MSCFLIKSTRKNSFTFIQIQDSTYQKLQHVRDFLKVNRFENNVLEYILITARTFSNALQGLYTLRYLSETISGTSVFRYNKWTSMVQDQIDDLGKCKIA